MNAFERMLEFNKRHQDKDVKGLYRAMQKYHLADKDKMAQIFVPSHSVFKLSPHLLIAYQTKTIGVNKTFADSSLKELELLEFFWGSHLFGTWRNTLGIYRIDNAIFSDVMKSPIPDDTPTTIFANLPEWAVYVEFPDFITFNDKHQCLGFWAVFDQNFLVNNKKELVLNIIPNLQDDVFQQLQPLQVIIKEDLSVKQSVELAYQSMPQTYSQEQLQVFMSNDYEMIAHFLSCLLLLCVQEPDISNIIGEPISRADIANREQPINKKTGTFIVPSAPIIYELGARLGGEIRKKQQEIEQGFSDGTRTVRPHIRRGHWHGYWRGTGQAKEFKVRWQPAIFVNA